jgi:hypothetical protein
LKYAQSALLLGERVTTFLGRAECC